MKKEEIMEILKEAIVSTHFVNKNNMKTKASIDKEQMESVDLTIEITMPVANWRVVKNAIEKGKDGYYGPAWDGGETAVYQVLTWSKEIQALQSKLDRAIKLCEEEKKGVGGLAGANSWFASKILDLLK